MNNQIFLVDLNEDHEGHHFIFRTLEKIENTEAIDTKEKKILIRKNPIQGVCERIRMYKRVFREIEEKQNSPAIVHFVTGDKFYFLPILLSPEKTDRKVIVTIHRFPSNTILRYLLRNFSKKITSIVVFSEYLKEQLYKIGIKNVTHIPHTTFYDYSKIPSKHILKEKYNISNSATVISALGGTRYEKGLDILLESFKFLSKEIKHNIILNIAGREQDFKKDYIIELAQKNNVRFRLDLRNLSDTEFSENVVLTDIMLVPYRKSFIAGASGPMLEAISQGIPCLFAKNRSFEQFETKHKIGRYFDIENPLSLAEELKKMIEGDYEFDTKYASTLSNEEFIVNHEYIYSSIFANMHNFNK